MNPLPHMTRRAVTTSRQTHMIEAQTQGRESTWPGGHGGAAGVLIHWRTLLLPVSVSVLLDLQRT
jgi:hypothetical protein